MDFLRLSNIRDYLFLWLFQDCLSNYLGYRKAYLRNFLRFYHVNVYYITGSEAVFTPENAKELGAKGYLKKPVEMKDLFNVLDEIKHNFGETI